MDRIADVVIVDADGPLKGSDAWSLHQEIKSLQRVATIALVPRETLPSLDFALGIDDFVVKPFDAPEVITRIKQILWRVSNIDTNNIIRCGGLVMNVDSCEVFLKGKVIMLTFREYELLQCLMSNRGRTFSREALLNKVWGYDYYGGDRTVDVHIRRVRSKIEDVEHVFIETVRNMGYRFRAE
ncbi:MAG: response regulator transcription factor [Dehalococcoidia bacterium]|nr:response regulator transcription factor [Dehalococcoidia bacterium]